MKPVLTIALSLMFAIYLAEGAPAAATTWKEEVGGRIRLVAAEPAAGDTQIKAALQIELKDGWKTYWRDPGDAGVPPQISVTGEGVSLAQMYYPAPERFVDGKSVWAGYKHMVSFPLTINLAADARSFTITANTFLGICEDICIPVQNEFTLDVPKAVGSTADQALVASFYDALPQSAREDFRIAEFKAAGEMVEFDLTAPSDAEPIEVFLAADGYMFGSPQPVSQGPTNSRYAARIVFAPKNNSSADVFYTLKSAKGAVSGTVPLKAVP